MLDQHTAEQIKSYGTAAGMISLSQFISALSTTAQLLTLFVGLAIGLIRLEKDWKARQARNKSEK